MDEEPTTNLPVPADDPQWRHLLHVKFADEYLRCGNAGEAARRAGYQASSDLAYQRIGARLLQRVDIQTHVGTHLRAHITGEEAGATLAAMIRGTMADYVDVDEDGQPVLNLNKVEAQEGMHLVQKLTPTKHGYSIQLYSKLEALGLLMRHIEVHDRATMQKRTAEEFLSQLPPEVQDQVRCLLLGDVIEGEQPITADSADVDLSFLQEPDRG